MHDRAFDLEERHMDVEDLTRSAVLGPVLAQATGDDRWLRHEARLIAGGKSNLTFELTSEAGALVLRRPPTGHLLASAHDMGREVRVQRALVETAVPVPEVVFFDAEGVVLGVPAYAMAKVEGHVVRDALPAGYATTPTERAGLADSLIDTLVALHSIDPAEVGLGDFGRPEGFLARQIRRWGSQWGQSASRPVPEVTRLSALLTERLPSSPRAAIVHGDFRIDNCILDAVDPARVAAVLDWEMATLGDPMTDLGMLLFYWREADQGQHPLIPTVTTEPGFPTRRHLCERYAAATGVSLEEIDYYRAFANFKFAVIAEGISARVAAGAMAGQDFGNLDSLVLECATTGLELLEKKG